jgi:tetratricopeptide (TPR) repeat protein
MLQWDTLEAATRSTEALGSLMQTMKKILDIVLFTAVALLAACQMSSAAPARIRPVQASTAHTNAMNHDPQVREAYDHYYNLDYPGAVARFERYHQEHPGDPHPTAMLLNAMVFQELYRQDVLDTTFYANDGFLTGHHAVSEDIHARDRIFALADEAVNEASWRIGRNPNDIDALFDRAWARSLRCTYIAMVERGFRAGFHLANQARDDANRVIQLDPNYVDAKLIAGVYQYVVGALPLPFKILVGFAGITGSKSTGMALLNDAGQRSNIVSLESRTAIALFLRRESKYKEAIQVIRVMKAQYPHNYLLCLEEANLRKDAGEGMVAVESYRQLLADAARPGYFADACLELADFGLGDSLRGQRHYQEAAAAYERAAWAPTVGPELKIRALLSAGECRDVAGERPLAVRDYQAVIAAGPSNSRADQARKHLRSPYRGN